MSFLISGSSITMTFLGYTKIEDSNENLNKQTAFSHRVSAACLLLCYIVLLAIQNNPYPEHEYDTRRLSLTTDQVTSET